MLNFASSAFSPTVYVIIGLHLSLQLTLVKVMISFSGSLHIPSLHQFEMAHLLIL